MILNVADRAEAVLAHATRPTLYRLYRRQHAQATYFDCKRTGRLRLRCTIGVQVRFHGTGYKLRCIDERLILGRYHRPLTLSNLSGWATWPGHHSITFNPVTTWVTCGGG